MANTLQKGLFIVLEGVDRCGKSTQVKRIVNAFKAGGKEANLIFFPDRRTPIGGLIDQYLRHKLDLDDHAVHLLFTANRWEAHKVILAKLEAGEHVICDRYSYSGVAFSAAKSGMDLEWCNAPEEGLPRPDLVLYLTLNEEAAERRGGFGIERYEKSDFQARVRDNYALLARGVGSRWREVDAEGTEEEVEHRLMSEIKRNFEWL